MLQKGQLMGQTNWTSLGQPGEHFEVGSSPTVIQNTDGGLEVFLTGIDGSTGLDGRLRHIWQTIPGKAWSTWASLNTPPNMLSLVAARNADGRIEAFTMASSDTTGSDLVLWHFMKTMPGNDWGTWFSLGKPSSLVGLGGGALCVESNLDGRLEVFAWGSDVTLWHIWQLTPNGLWSTWASLNTPPNMDSSPVAVRNADGRIEVFVQAEDGLWHIWQTAPGGSWSSWNSLGTPPGSVGVIAGTLCVESNLDGRLEAFVGDSYNTLWHIWQLRPGGSWGSWNSLDQPPSVSSSSASGSSLFMYPCVAQNKDGHLEAFITVEDGALWHIWQQTPGGTWGGWHSLGTPPDATSTHSSTPCVIANADGRLEAFITTSDGALWHTWQVTPGGEWGS